MITLSIADVLVALSCFGGFAGVIYAAGKLSARVDSLEEWRRAMPEKLDQIHESIRELGRTFSGEVH